MPSPPFCRKCEQIDGRRIILERDQGPLLACPECGLVDEKETANDTFVSVSENVGAILDENAHLQTREYQRQWLAAKFEEGLSDLLNLYLGSTDPSTSLIGVQADSIRSGVRQWFNRILEAEAKRYKQPPTVRNATSKRTKYLLVIAIKMALNESALVVLDVRLEAKKCTRANKRTLPGYVKGDEKLPNCSLMDIFNRAHSFSEDHFGRLDSYSYLSSMYKRYSRLLRFELTPLEYTLITLGTIVERLRSLVALPFAQRLKVLMTKPPHTQKKRREWTEDDWVFFETVDWSLVLPYGFNLFQAQECVRLWGHRSSVNCSIALTIWAMQAERKAVMPSQTAITEELCAPYGTQHWAASERYRDMRNMLLAWSTSITEAGLPFPLIPVPPKGTLGNGTGGYNCDSRRPIPETDLAVNAAPIIAIYWPQIVRTRLRTRNDFMSFEDETWLARKMCVIRAAAHEKPGKKQKFSTYAMEAKKSILTYQPWLKVRVVPNGSAPQARAGTTGPLSARSSVSPAPSASSRNATSAIAVSRLASRASSHSGQANITSGLARPSLSTAPPTSASVRAMPATGTMTAPTRPFIPPPPEKTIEDMLATQDDSSDEDERGNASSDDDSTPRHPSIKGLGLQNVNQARQPFSFTIGPSGFNADTERAQSSQSSTRPAVNPNRFWQLGSHASTSMARLSSAESDTLPTSAPQVDTTPEQPIASSVNVLGNRASPSASQSSRTSLSPAPSSSYAVSPLMSRQSSMDSRASTPMTSISIANLPRSRARSMDLSTLSSPAPYSIGLSLAQPRPDDDPHVGVLVREREEYVQFRLAHFVEAGGMVKPPLEAYMWNWLRQQIQNDSMPAKITPTYLLSIGLNDDPRKLDLGEWIESNSYRWSAIECLLRAGIKPKEFPAHHLPHSILDLDLVLNHHPSTLKSDLTNLGPNNTSTPSKEELDMLFSRDTGDDWEHCLLDEKEVKKRKDAYVKAGFWDFAGDDVQPPANRSRFGRQQGLEAEERDYEGLEKFADEEEEEEDDKEDSNHTASERSRSRSRTRTVSTTPFDNYRSEGERTARKDIKKIMSTIKHTRKSHGHGKKRKGNSKDEDLDGLIGAVHGGDFDDGDGEFEEAMLRDALMVGGALESEDEGSGGDSEEDVDVDEEDENDDEGYEDEEEGNSKGKGKAKEMGKGKSVKRKRSGGGEGAKKKKKA